MTAISTTHLNAITDNLSNGNLTEAKKLAKRFSVSSLANALYNDGNGANGPMRQHSTSKAIVRGNSIVIA